MPAFEITNEFVLDVVRGKIDGWSAVRKFGHNRTIGTTWETLWDGNGGKYSYIGVNSATQLKLSSSSSLDTLGEAGLNTIRITGQTSGFIEVTEEQDMNGQEVVLTDNEYIRVYRMEGLTAGNSSTSIGDIFLGDGAVDEGEPATIYAQIDVTDEHNQTQMAIYTIPAGKTGYIIGDFIGTSKEKETNVLISIRRPDEMFRSNEQNIIYQTRDRGLYSIPIQVPEKSDIEMRAKVGQTTGDVTGGFYVLLFNEVE